MRPGTTVWYGTHQPVPNPAINTRGKTRTHLVRDAEHQPISVKALAQGLAPSCFRTVTWREGSAAKLSSRFARLRVRVRVRAAHRDAIHAEEWLIIEWPQNEVEPTRYWLSTLSAKSTFKQLAATIKARWRIERDYQELKQEFGLGHYEGRNWRGFHHHASLCIAAYAFLMLERLTHAKKRRSIRRTCRTQRLSDARVCIQCSATYLTRLRRYDFASDARSRAGSSSARAAVNRIDVANKFNNTEGLRLI